MRASGALRTGWAGVCARRPRPCGSRCPALSAHPGSGGVATATVFPARVFPARAHFLPSPPLHQHQPYSHRRRHHERQGGRGHPAAARTAPPPQRLGAVFGRWPWSRGVPLDVPVPLGGATAALLGAAAGYWSRPRRSHTPSSSPSAPRSPPSTKPPSFLHPWSAGEAAPLLAAGAARPRPIGWAAGSAAARPTRTQLRPSPPAAIGPAPPQRRLPPPATARPTAPRPRLRPPAADGPTPPRGQLPPPRAVGSAPPRGQLPPPAAAGSAPPRPRLSPPAAAGPDQQRRRLPPPATARPTRPLPGLRQPAAPRPAPQRPGLPPSFSQPALGTRAWAVPRLLGRPRNGLFQVLDDRGA